jgi:hypothetical protein
MPLGLSEICQFIEPDDVLMKGMTISVSMDQSQDTTLELEYYETYDPKNVSYLFDPRIKKKQIEFRFHSGSSNVKIRLNEAVSSSEAWKRLGKAISKSSTLK